MVLVEPDSPPRRGAEVPQPRTAPRSRPREPSTPPPRRSDASFSGSSGRASYSWDDGRTERRSRASSDEASALERHFDSIASIKGKRVQPPTRLWQSREGGALWLSGMPTEESLASYPRCDIQLCWFRESLTCPGGAVIPNPSDADCHHRSQVARPAVEKGSLARDSADPDEWRLGAGTLCCRSSPSCWRPGSHPFAPSATVGRLRECQIYKLMEQGSIAQWIRHVRRTAPSRCIPTERSQIHLDLGRGIPLCRHRQGSDAGQWTLQRVADLQEAEGYQRAFCRDCLQRASAVFRPK